MSRGWSLEERTRALARAERDGVDLLVIGGGVTGAGVLRDAASRGLRALLVERGDFASGTSSRSSKFVHGGLRYIAEGQLALTREACRERDLLMRLNPHLVRPLSFLFPAWEGGGIPLWQVRAALFTYSALAHFRGTARHRMLGPEEALRLCPDLAPDGLRGAGLYSDGQTDDARLVIETLVSARRLGAEAVHHCPVTEFFRDADGRLAGARLRDRLTGRARSVRAAVVVNAAGPSVERVRGLDRPVLQPELRPAKGVHLVIPGGRVRARGAVTFQAPDGRHLFLAPWGDVAILGTTDRFSDEIDEPVVTIEEVHYLLAAAHAAFPRAGLSTNDLRSVWAGVRPLAAAPDDATPSTSVSREDRVYEDPSGLISVTGGKLTTHRAMGEKLVDRALRRLPRQQRAAAGPSRTRVLPLREESCDPAEVEQALRGSFDLPEAMARHLARSWGADAERLLREAPSQERRAIGGSCFSYAELRWSWRTECPSDLCDLLERRIRLALQAVGQGLPELEDIARCVGEEAGWDAERIREEMAGYARAVRTRYQIAAPEPVSRAARVRGREHRAA